MYKGLYLIVNISTIKDEYDPCAHFRGKYIWAKKIYDPSCILQGRI